MSVEQNVNKMLIVDHLPQILKLISENPVVSIVANTGTGKSTMLPAAIANVDARCFVVVPTRTSAISLATYQSYIQEAINPNADVKNIVGYSAEGKSTYNDKTMIVYATSGHIRRKMLSYFSNGIASKIDFCKVLIVDEFHSGSIDNTIIISLWMQARASKVGVPRLVIVSATPIPMVIDPPPVKYIVDIKGYPIEYKYLDKDISIDDNKTMYTDIANIVSDIHNNTNVGTGHILIFVAGASDVENMTESLKKDVKQSTDKILDIIPAFGALKREDINLIYKITAENERKLIISTNIAETSITINNVGYVIDTLIEKMSETSQSGGFRLTTHYISKDSAKQRAGRTGRTIPGICFRMCTKSTFEKLEEHRPPEIERVPIYDTVMELLDVGLSPEKVILGVNIEKVTFSINLLNFLGMVINEPKSIMVTNMGHFATKFHISVRNSAFLWYWVTYNGLRYTDEYIKTGHDMLNINLENMEIDETSEYSSIKLSHMNQVANIYQQENLNPSSIIDATANVGGDSINFMRLYPNAHLISIEKDQNIARILRRNLENLPHILGTNHKYNTYAINMSSPEYFLNPRYSDVIFFDPPWGGKDYKYQEKIELKLDDVSISSIIGYILSKGYTQIVILKVPFNFDLDNFRKDLESYQIENIKIYDVLNDYNQNVDYRLIFLRTNNVNLVSSFIMNENIPPEVPLVSVSLPNFVGIVVSCLIDTYGPSYFWIPRKTSDMTKEEYNTMLEDYIKTYFEKYIGYNDLETFLNMWNDLLNTVGDLYAKENLFADWAKKNSINNKKIHELINIIKKSIKTLIGLGYEVQIGPFTTHGVMKAARPLLLKAYKDKIMSHLSGTTYIDQITKEKYKLDSQNFTNGFVNDHPLAIIALITAEIKTQARTFRIIGFGIDIDKIHKIHKIHKIQKIEPKNIKSTTKRTTNVISRRPQISNNQIVGLKQPKKSISNALSLLENIDLEVSTPETPDDFPYKHLSLNLSDIDQRFKRLQDYEFRLIDMHYTIRNINEKWVNDVKNDYHDKIILLDVNDYINYDLISDYFTDICRMKAKRFDQSLSPFEYWNENKQVVANNAQQKYGEINAYTLREAIYHLAGEVTTFRPTIAVGFIKMFHANRVLDFSSGWGDRLIAAIACNVDYVGVDPNTCLHPKYKQIIEHFGKIPGKYTMIQSPFETAILPDKTYDMILTSPPYFDLEIYTSEITQSIHDRNLDKWFSDFLMTSLDKAWSYLEEKGHMIIIINDKPKGEKYTKRMIDTFNEQHNDAIFLGVISYSEIINDKLKNPQPCWIWEKGPKIIIPQISTLQISISKILPLLDTLNFDDNFVVIRNNIIPTLDREYNRYWYVNSMKDYIENALPQKQAYEALNCLERWLIGLSNIYSEPDPIFSSEKLEVEHNLVITFYNQLVEKNIPNPEIIVGECISIALQFVSLDAFEEAPYPERNNDTIIVGPYSRIFPPGKIDILLQNGDLDDIGVMSLRYSCLIPRGQNWNIPLHIHNTLIQKYGFTIEGFATPINSQFLYRNLNFCSMFPDTDNKFGSLGSFFNQVFDNVKVFANPPQIPDLMEHMTTHVLHSLEHATNLIIAMTVPRWSDASFYQRLVNSEYLQKLVMLDSYEYYYHDTNNGNAFVLSNFPSTVIIVAKGYNDVDFTQMKYDIGTTWKSELLKIIPGHQKKLLNNPPPLKVYNPEGLDKDIPLILEQVSCGNKDFTVIQDTYLQVGTKQRGIKFFIDIKQKGFNSIITYGTPYGYGQVATAWSCMMTGLSCTIVVEKIEPRTEMTMLADKYGANIIEVPIGSNNGTKKNKAMEYIINAGRQKFVELGLDDPEFIDALASSISRVKSGINPKRLWVAGGSVVLSRALSKAFPNTELQIVQVGRTIWPDLLKGMKHKIYVSKQPFPQHAMVIPPYQSLINYDAKVWEFVCKFGQSGDYIWNVK